MLILISLVLALFIGKLLLKNIIARPRPFIDTHSLFYTFYMQVGSLKASGFSFPSRHTTSSLDFSVIMVLTSRSKK